MFHKFLIVIEPAVNVLYKHGLWLVTHTHKKVLYMPCAYIFYMHMECQYFLFFYLPSLFCSFANWPVSNDSLT